MKRLHHLPQDCTSSGRGVETKFQQIDAINVKSMHPCAKLINPKGEKLGTCDLEGIKRSPAEPLEVAKDLTPGLGC